MKKVVFVLVISLFMVVVSPLAKAALTLNPVDQKTAELYTDSVDPADCYLSIPSDIDYIVESIPPIWTFDAGQLDGLDWVLVTNSSPLAYSPSLIATIRLTGPDFLALNR